MDTSTRTYPLTIVKVVVATAMGGSMLLMLAVAPAQAATLTPSQIQAITALLVSF